MLPLVGALRPWADPSVLHLRRLPMHVPLTGFERRSLDGDWSLTMFDHPDQVPDEAITAAAVDAATVAVPGNWTMQELRSSSGEPFVDLPHYTNIQMPHAGAPPTLPDRNPTGVYRRTFSLPQRWMRQKTVLHLAGAESAHVVYLNGEFVGYGTDSRLPSEYDLSEHARSGVNELAVVVVRFSAHSFIEDQDQWWMAGLHRSVWIESRPRTHLCDVIVDTDYDPDAGVGRVDVDAVVDFGGVPGAGWTVAATLHAPNGRRVGRRRTGPVPHVIDRQYEFTGTRVRLDWTVPAARPWSAERPDRYTVTTELIDPNGRVRHTEHQRVGLRRVEVSGRELLVNGRPIWIFGVNRHDHHPDRGKAVTVEDLRADLEVMRRHNITAIRTSHYPNDTAFYELCDELGFYLIDEANIESHGYYSSVCIDPSYRSAFLDRGARMVQRDRNHPSIVMWSLGNESGYGENHDALAGWIRRTDPSRPLHYEAAIRIEGWADGGRRVTDVVAPMYPEIDDLIAYGSTADADRPLIICEYSHAMGNSNGSLADYWDAILATPGLQGGFLWEWKDHGLRQRLPDGTARLAYGGQFGESPHDGNFVADGLVSADLEPHPAMAEVSWVYRPVTTERSERGLRIANRRSFEDLADLAARYRYTVDGEVLAQGRLDHPPVGPGEAVDIELPAMVEPAANARLDVVWETRRETWYAAAGHRVAWDQVPLGPSRPRRAPRDGEHPGALAGEPHLSIWRAAIDNDGYKLMPNFTEESGIGSVALARWMASGIHDRPADALVDHDMTVTEDRHGVTYRHVVDVPPELADIPRVGVVLALPGRFGAVRYLGRGPHENYPDRNRSAMVGIWEGPPDELPYLVPQEFGLRTDCRWLELEDPSTGEIIRIDAIGRAPFHFSAIHHRAEDLFAAPTVPDLLRRDELIVHLDAAHRGVGTGSCGPDVLPRYRIEAGRYELHYRISRRVRA